MLSYKQKQNYLKLINIFRFICRLGDGAILQNLYPSHSHVKLRNGTVERIDAYCQRMIDSRDLLKEIATVKDYEYNQWARTRSLNEKDYEGSKAIPVDKIESKSTQPTWDTIRPMNTSLVTLGTKNRVFSYEDIVSKFSQPKFLKRLGFIDNESDYNPIKFTLGDDGPEMAFTHQEIDPLVKINNKNTSAISEQKKSIASSCEDTTEYDGEVEEESESEELSSDDEEYHNERHLHSPSSEDLPPERVPSSRRSARQRLAVYNDDCVIGSKSVVGKTTPVTDNSKPPSIHGEDERAMTISTVQIVDDLIHHTDTNGKFTAVIPKHKTNGSFHPRFIKKDFSSKFDLQPNQQHKDRKFVRFSQPVCLCPKLSKETLSSFRSPTMQRYLSNHVNGFMRCQLHSTACRQSRFREKIVLKSL